MHYIQTLLLVAATLSMSASRSYANPANDIAIDGVFVGTMQLADGVAREIPLQISLNVSSETILEETPNGPQERRVIDGSALIDDEGGPYAFAKVTYDIDSNTIDMRYSRMGPQDLERLPASLRFTGSFQEDGSLTGRVVSGFVGRIGTFSLKRSDLPHLQVTHKYRGRWEGTTRYLKTGEVKSTFVVLETAQTSAINPPNFELGFTPGKVGSYTFGYGQIGFSHAHIDYLRRKVVLIDAAGGKNSLDMELDIDFENGTLKGFVNSVYGGRSAVVDYKRVPDAK